jgi:SAM-dependent methyltransferase
MSHVTEHYDVLLADHYSWMFGVSAVEKATEQRELLTRLGLAPDELAVDLGAGPGFQSMALAELGFKRVLAIDTSAKLLEELRSNSAGRDIEVIQDDMMNISQHVASGTVDAIVCMGDTLTHLPERQLVSRLFADVFRALRWGGKLILTFRDLSSELRGLDRFIPVRNTPDKIMTCFLEYGPDVVTVHDLIHIRDGITWRLTKSCYPKLRLSCDAIRRDLEMTGFEVDVAESFRGMVVFAVHRP